jgi:hypothetical protein
LKNESNKSRRLPRSRFGHRLPAGAAAIRDGCCLAASYASSTWQIYKKFENILGGGAGLRRSSCRCWIVVVVLPVALLALTLADSIGPALDWLR